MKKKMIVLLALVMSFSLCLSACDLKPIEEAPAAAPSSAPAEGSDAQQSESSTAPGAAENSSADKPASASAASSSDISQVTEYPSTASDVKTAAPVLPASGSDIAVSSGKYAVSLASDNRYYASDEPTGAAGELTFFVEEVFWEDAGLTIAGTVINNTSAAVKDPVVKRFTVSNDETVISDGKLDVFGGCSVAAGSSTYWEIFIPMDLVSAPYALLNTFKTEITFG